MSSGPENSSEVFISELKEVAGILLNKLEGDHYEEAMEVINRLVEVRDQSVFTAVGNLTRALHEAIKNVNVDADFTSEPTTISASDMTDASDRLSYVITMTKSAADNTLERVESSVPIAVGLGRQAGELRTHWQRYRGDTPAVLDPEFQQGMDDFFANVDDGMVKLREFLQDILLEQAYQDLTGQVLERVIALIKGVEHDLVELVKIAGQVETLAGLVEEAGEERRQRPAKKGIEAEGPMVGSGTRAEVVAGQDEVDELLSNLGF